MKYGKKIVLAVMLIAIAYLFADQALAEVVGANSVEPISSTRANLSGGEAASTYAQAGNVTLMTINTTLITEFWAGFVGNVSGNIVLSDGSNNSMYDWDFDGVVTGEIYASRESSIDFTTIACMDPANMTQEELAIGQNSSTSKGDNVSATFLNTTNHPAFSVGGIDIIANSCPAMNIYNGSGAQTVSWFNVLLRAGEGAAAHSVYTSLINDSTPGYDNRTYDFQMLVGVNGNTAQGGGPVEYYFWVELQDS